MYTLMSKLNYNDPLWNISQCYVIPEKKCQPDFFPVFTVDCILESQLLFIFYYFFLFSFQVDKPFWLFNFTDVREFMSNGCANKTERTTDTHGLTGALKFVT